jgi:hypothetical protein
MERGTVNENLKKHDLSSREGEIGGQIGRIIP